MVKKEGSNKTLFIALFAVILIAAVVVVFLLISSYTKQCGDRTCFNSALQDCKKASFIQESSESSWQYTINGKSGTDCKVNVQLEQVKIGTVDLEKLEGLDMECYVPYGYIGDPQADLTLCHGILKEQMQDMMIRKMHAYILENMGQISEELTNSSI